MYPVSVCPSRQLPYPFKAASIQLLHLRSSPPLRASPATPDPKIVAAAADDASTAASGTAVSVKAAFTEAGLSQDAIDYVLTQYPHYLRWDVEQKLLPAMQEKQQELGARFPAEVRRIPKMLLASRETQATAQSARKAAKFKAASDNAMCVKAAFAEAGFSEDAVNHIVRQYPHYLSWKVEDKLLPAIQSWRHELGASFLSELERVPTLLRMKPAEELLKNQYLASIGIKSPERLRKRAPCAFTQPLTSMQGKVAFLSQWGFTKVQILSLIEKHPNVLLRTSEHIGDLLRLIEDMFECADKKTLCDAMLSCNCVGLCSQSVESLHHNFTYFCTCVAIEGDHKQMTQAWKKGVFVVPPAELDSRLSFVGAQLSATMDEVQAVFRRAPQLTLLLPETLGLHVTQLLGLGFSHSQVKRMCVWLPTLLALSYTSQVQADKWAFLTRIMQLDHDEIAAKPYLLIYSLRNRLGPRWEFWQQLKLLGGVTFTASIGSLMVKTDASFRAVYTTPQLGVYDEHFQKQWQRRWDFLLVDQQLRIQDIADNPDLLHVPLKMDT